jgi:hypothetical protein
MRGLGVGRRRVHRRERRRPGCAIAKSPRVKTVQIIARKPVLILRNEANFPAGGPGPNGGRVSTLMSIQFAFENAGIIFQDENAGWRDRS